MRKVLLIALLASAFTLTGCPKPETVKETPSAPPADSSAQSPVESTETGEGERLDAREQARRRAMAQRVIYFDFDNADIRPEYREVLANHAQYAATNPSMKVRLEGHADERGSREYNIGLGERRAQAVRRALMLQGTGDAQLVTVSYGEERPAESGSDEAAWAKNRRVELVYGN
ncbi:MAG TPA: peptidoglycan-associated lipoprotein Pal [Steroidobacteraceae bacterium]